MRTLIALGVMSAPALAAPVPRELRKPPAEQLPPQPTDLLDQFRNNKFDHQWQVGHRSDMPQRLNPDVPANGKTTPIK